MKRSTTRSLPRSPRPASKTANESTGTASSGGAPSISADGRYVAFISDAQNLGEHGPAGVQEAYVKDLHTGEVKLVSRANGLDGEPANELGEGIGVEDAAISGDGRYVIFTSAASNLVGGLPPAAPEEHPLHVYRRDLQTGETTLVDRVTGAQGASSANAAREPRRSPRMAASYSSEMASKTSKTPPAATNRGSIPSTCATCRPAPRPRSAALTAQAGNMPTNRAVALRSRPKDATSPS